MGAMSVWHWLVLFVVVPPQFAVAIWIIGLFAFKDREPDERAFKPLPRRGRHGAFYLRLGHPAPRS